MNERFKIALVGAGLITQQAHLPAALASDLIEVSAIVDPAPGRAAALARDWGIKATTATHLREVISQIDGAVIATPNDSHAELGMECVNAGVAILIEKPLCSSYPDAKALVDAAARNDVTLATGYSTRFRDSTCFLKDLLDRGEFGAVKRFVHQFGTAGGWAALSSYILKRESAGGGVLVVSGTHFIDRMLYFWGYPDACALEDDGAAGPEANAAASFTFHQAGGTINGMARYSKTGLLPAGMVIETDRGLVRLADNDSANIEFFPLTNPNVSIAYTRRGPPRFDPGISVYQHQLEDFAAAARTRRPPLVDGRQGMESLRLIETLYQGRKTKIEDWYRPGGMA
ncbi:MAG: Gfo/Idh/MocA family oxidoreductase [Burkholderiales bacterium]|nr:Gfo/Idh/MocA family oxidoreductase [Burkholderiales bacterium]